MSQVCPPFPHWFFPSIRFVTPQSGSAVASGLARPGVPSAAGSFIMINLVARKGIAPILVREGPAGGATPPNPNPNFPGLLLTFNRALVAPNGTVIPAGTNLASLFQFSGSEVQGSTVLTTFFWFVGGSLPQLPTTLTMLAQITDSAGLTSPPVTRTVLIIPGISGDALTPNP